MRPEIGVRARFLFAAALLAVLASCAGPRQSEDEIVHYRVIEASDPHSARQSAHALLAYLAAGKIAEAAALSNAPQRRLEVLRDYRASIGEEEFRRVFAQYLEPQNRLVAEAAIGRHHLLIWELASAGGHLAGQYYVEVDGRFLMDDEPSAQRSQLRRVLEDYRKKKSGSDPDF